MIVPWYASFDAIGEVKVNVQVPNWSVVATAGTWYCCPVTVSR